MSNPAAALQQLHQNLSKVVQAPGQTMMLTMTCLLSGGHLLLESQPGTGKSTLTRALARSLQLQTRRIQCSIDLLPADILGFSSWDSNKQLQRTIQGPVFTNLLLLDEINRAAPRVQAALLEAMDDNTVSIDGTSIALPEPFTLIATRNPDSFIGTYPMPEPLLDRFCMRLTLDYPNAEQEQALLMARLHGDPLEQLEPVMDARTLQHLQKLCERMPMSEALIGYISQLMRATRQHPQVQLGASPRAALALMRCGRAMALLSNRKTVTPALIQSLLDPVVSHRLVFRDARYQNAASRAEFWQEIIEQVATPDQPSAKAS